MQRLQFAGCLGHEQADLPVSGMEAESDGRAVFSAQAAMRAQDQELGIEQAIRVPAHAGVLSQAEEIARWLREQHLSGERQLARRSARVRGDCEKAGSADSSTDVSEIEAMGVSFRSHSIETGPAMG